jgi:hypothetical protein
MGVHKVFMIKDLLPVYRRKVPTSFLITKILSALRVQQQLLRIIGILGLMQMRSLTLIRHWM